jgi:hypothetical protein
MVIHLYFTIIAMRKILAIMAALITGSIGIVAISTAQQALAILGVNH